MSAKSRLQAHGIGGGVRGGNHLVYDAVLDSADQTGLAVKHPRKPVQQGGHSGLSVGAGNGDDLEPSRLDCRGN